MWRTCNALRLRRTASSSATRALALNLHVAGLQCIGGFGELRLEFGYPRVGALNLHVAGLQCIGGFGELRLEFGYPRVGALNLHVMACTLRFRRIAPEFGYSALARFQLP